MRGWTGLGSQAFPQGLDGQLITRPVYQLPENP
jgi:hypothetical protein